ncbi:hypothetical protein P4C99_01690 [Pontiellaceae bacterium B1224]|nr:hypothetical protein [Pontiellaceae bacterium B1224]
MKKETSVKTQNGAVECAHNRICQTEGGAPHCNITCRVAGTIYFTDTRFPEICPMQHTYGSTYICTCPIRQEIYIKKNS